MIETEAKLKIEREDLEKIIDLVGPLEFSLQKNRIYFFDGGFLRIRNEKGKVILTCKGKSNWGKYNSREEIEFEVSNEDNLKLMLSFLGFKEGFYYEKNRASLELNGCYVCVDLLPNNEAYLEVEGSEDDISRNLAYLGLGERALEKRSYQEILQNA